MSSVATPPFPIELSETSVVRLPERRLTPREARVALALRKLDPRLADLFHQALLLSSVRDRAAYAGVAAHAARELNRGILFKLVSYMQLTSDEREETEESEEQAPESQVEAMARVLGVDVDHSTARFWHRLHRDLVGAAHFRGMSGEKVIRAMKALSELTGVLDALVGPYFDVESELDAILAKLTPGDTDFAFVLGALGNRQLRWHCFRNFSGAGWLRGLEQRGCFVEPPMARRFENGAWSPDVWVEGGYLLRIVDEAPEAVAAILARTPKTNDNPAVWDIVAKCMFALPIENSVSLHRVLARGLTSVPFVVWPRPVVQVIERFASNGNSAAAAKLARGLCSLARPSAPDQMLAHFGLSKPPIFGRIDAHSVQDVVPAVASAITTADPQRAFTWLFDGLRAALAMSGQASPHETGFRRVWRRLKKQTRAMLYRIRGKKLRNSPSEGSEWCVRLDTDNHENDSRVIFARSLAHAAAALASRSEEDARRTLDRLAGEHHDIFQRIWRYTLARCSPFALDNLDVWIASEEAVRQSPRDRERGDLLRRRFSEATPAAQLAFLQRVDAGPSEKEARRRVARAAEWGEQSSVEAERTRWKIQRLRRFDAELPDILRPIADKLGYTATPRSPEREGLDEDGSYSGGVSWRSEPSPVDSVQLEKMDDRAVADLLRTWSPTSGDIDGPSLRGLHEAVSALITTRPDRGIAIAAEFGNTISARIVAVIASGLRSSVVSEPSANALAVYQWVGRMASVIPVPRELTASVDQGWSEPHDAAQQCLEALKAWIPAASGAPDVEAAWKSVDEWIASPIVWDAPDSFSDVTGDALLLASMNSLQGIIAHIVMTAGLQRYRTNLTVHGAVTAEDTVGAKLGASIDLVPRLDLLLELGSERSATLAALGEWLPTLHFFARQWVLANKERLLAHLSDGSPLSSFWSAYILRGGLDESLFAVFRTEYLHTVEILATVPRDGAWSIPQVLADHLTVAMLRGSATLNDPDHLLQTAWQRFQVDDLSHAYWAVFRRWSDAAEPPPPAELARLVELWDWRLAELRSGGLDTDRVRAEANALGWWCVTPYVDDETVLSRGRSTLELADARNSAVMGLWERLRTMPDDKADAVWKVIASAVAAEQRGPYPRLFASELGPLLVRVAAHGTRETAADVRDLVNALGAQGLTEFRQYLPPPQPPTTPQFPL
jgi:hypothetical protein